MKPKNLIFSMLAILVAFTGAFAMNNAASHPYVLYSTVGGSVYCEQTSLLCSDVGVIACKIQIVGVTGSFKAYKPGCIEIMNNGTNSNSVGIYMVEHDDRFTRVYNPLY